jgi:hypothetical protein
LSPARTTKASGLQEDLHAGGLALAFKQVGNFARGRIAEKLPKGLLVKGNVVLFHEGDEVLRRVPRQG